MSAPMRVERLAWARASTAAALFAVALIGLLAGGRYVGSGDTVPAELLPSVLLETGRPDFAPLFGRAEELPYWFRRVEGRVVSIYPILPGLLNVPVLAVAKAAGRDIRTRSTGPSRLSAAWIGALSVALLYLALAPLCPQGTAVLFALVYAFGTELFSLAGRGMWQHGSALLFINASLALLLTFRPALVALSGLTLGLAVCSRPTTLLLAGLVGLWVARRERGALAGFLLWAAIPAVLLVGYSSRYLGSPWAMGQLLGAGNFGAFSFLALLGLLFSPSRGLFVLNPIFLPGLAPLARPDADERARSLLRHMACFVPLLVVLTSFWPNWWGGHSFGYRLLTETVPILIIGSALAWDTLLARSRARRLLGGALLAWGVLAHALGAYVPSGFNSDPNDIDDHPERLWNVVDSEIPRSARNLWWTGGRYRRPQARRANVILVSLDTLRADHLGAYGYPRATSPHIDALARESVLFEQAISQAPTTRRSHLSLLRSRIPSHPARKAPPLARVLRDAGYRTAAFTGGGQISAKHGFAEGFASYVEGPIGFTSSFTEVEAWLRAHGRKPFFLFLHTYAPSLPYDPEPPFDTLFLPVPRGGLQGRDTAKLLGRIRRSSQRRAARSEVALTDADREQIVALYDGEIRFVDEYVGRLVGLLREIGVWNRTILVLLSDHGEEFWDHGSVLHAHSVFQEVLRVPLIVHLPEGARAGTRVAEPVRLLDVAPTLYDLVRLPIPPAVQGTSLAARMQGKDARAPASMAQGGSASAWIDYPWKLIETRSGERGEWSAALYDLSSDPKETMDVASQNPDVVARLRQELALTLARRASRRAD